MAALLENSLALSFMDSALKKKQHAPVNVEDIKVPLIAGKFGELLSRARGSE